MYILYEINELVFFKFILMMVFLCLLKIVMFVKIELNVILLKIMMDELMILLHDLYNIVIIIIFIIVMVNFNLKELL